MIFLLFLFLTCAGFAADDSYDDDSTKGALSCLKRCVGRYWGPGGPCATKADGTGTRYGEDGSATCQIVNKKFADGVLWFQDASKEDKFAVTAVAATGLGGGAIFVVLSAVHMPMLLIVPPIAIATVAVVDRFCLSKRT